MNLQRRAIKIADLEHWAAKLDPLSVILLTTKSRRSSAKLQKQAWETKAPRLTGWQMA